MAIMLKFYHGGGRFEPAETGPRNPPAARDTETMPVPDIDPLTNLAIKHGTDKWGEHFYTPVYHDLFRDIRLEKLRVLEIGIGGFGLRDFGGESLRMWAEYFPNARIVGIDIHQKNLALPASVRCERGSQSDLAFLKRLVDGHGPFDIVVDDGSHRPDDMLASFGFLFPRMSERGIYVIEDTQTAFMPKWGGSQNGAKLLNFIAAMVQSLHRAEIRVEVPAYEPAEHLRDVKSVRAVHNLLIVEKGDNSQPSIFRFDAGHPAAQFALRSIAQRMRDDPNPACYARYATLMHHAGRPDEAFAAIEAGLELWADEPGLLMAGFDIAKARGDTGRARGYIERVKARSSDPMIGGLLASVEPRR
jgi:hypothetical protein